MWFVRGLGRTFLLAGFTMLLFVAYELIGTSAITNHHQSVLAKEFDESLLQPTPTPSITKTKPAAPKPEPPPRERTAIGRLIIPSINLRVIVVEGVTLADLAYGPGHYRNTPLPWQLGTTAIAGHRTGWSQPFFNFDKLRGGDIVKIQTRKGTFSYRITKTRQVEAEDSWVLAGNPASHARYQLTLTTCTPKYTSLHRFVVWADRIEK
jgi:sortase A